MPNSAVKPLILVVEDDPAVRNLIVAALEAHGLRHMAVETAHAAIAAASSQTPSIVLLDLGLPDMDGVKVVESVRAWSGMPIIVVSARSEDADKIRALDAGADDYLTKPFLTQELLLRIQRILQRCYRGELWRTAAKTLQLGQRTVYLADALVRLPDGTAQPLTATERALLQKLAENRGHIVTYDAVCEAVWGADYYGYENSLNVHIRHLREKLKPNPSKPQYLLTVRGIGYKLAEENAQ